MNDCGADPGELTREHSELGLALANVMFGVRFRCCMLEFFRGLLDCILEIGCVLLSVAAGSMSLKDKLDKHLRFRSKGTSRPDFGACLISADRFVARTARQRRC